MIKKKILIIGANSDIAIACAENYQSLGHEVILAGHKPNDLPIGFMKIDFDVQKSSPDQLIDLNFDLVVYCAGRFASAEMCFNELLTNEMIAVNFSSAVNIINRFAIQFKERKYGTIVGISSVAAVRGKQSTVIYGASKAGFDSYLAGLRSLLFDSNVKVLTVRPGFVATKMTKALKLPPMLTAQTQQIAQSIVKHSLQGNRSIVYHKPIWRFIMFVIRMIPERIFKRLKL